MFGHELSGCGFESSSSHLNFRFSTCFEQKVPWHSDNYRVRIHSETRNWHDKNIQSNAPYEYVFTTQLSYLVSLAKWLSVRLRIKWWWIRVQLESLKLQISGLFQGTSSLTFRQLHNVDSVSNTYVIWQEHSIKCTVQIGSHNSGESCGQFSQKVECSFTN